MTLKSDLLAETQRTFSGQMKAEVERIFPDVQFLSQLRKSQHVVLTRNRSIRLDKYFERRKPLEQVVKLRGRLEKKLFFQSARLFVKAHSKVSHVVAYRYEGEEKLQVSLRIRTYMASKRYHQGIRLQMAC